MLNQKLLKKLNSILPKKISISPSVLQRYSENYFYIKAMPDAICFAENENDVMEVVYFCMENKIPLVPCGGRTSVEGHTAAIHGGICLDLSKMDRVLTLNTRDQYIIVEPGITYHRVNEFLSTYQYCFPIEAGPKASIGGMMATNASGAGALDVGGMTKNVMGCSVITYENNKAIKIKTGGLSLKSSAGYNLTSLFVGSEGTLGIITEIILKIHKNLSHYATICCQFDELDSAMDFVIALKELVHFRRLELLDPLQTTVCIAYSNIQYLMNDKFTIIMELGGVQSIVQHEMSLVTDEIKKYNGINLKIFKTKQSSHSIWSMRKNVCLATIHFFKNNKKVIATDLCVPISRLAECIKACYLHARKFNIEAPLVAHAGDGNFHFTILVDPENHDEVQNVKHFNQLIIEEALKMGGTCTGEHGIGVGKKNYLAIQYQDSLLCMKKLKNALDPYNIFNPGKIID